MAGKVYLIGARPGDVELLTLKAVRALGATQVALIDDLVNREVLRYLPSHARVVEAGKRGGCRSTSQTFIERRMVQFARQGLCVARVKGGDPFVFGRGGEEVQVLRRRELGSPALVGIGEVVKLATVAKDWNALRCVA